ncbi:MAG: alginate export family protein [Polyangiaceae bacterium]
MAVLLSLTSATQEVALENADVNPSTSFLGAQLYGLKVTGHFLPLLQIEATGLARIVRTELTPTLTPSDTFVADLRVFGGYRGVTYSVEAAYQGGQVASYGANRPIEAIAVAGRLEWETALPLHLTFGLQGAYATGDNGTPTSTDKMTRFDPILPDQTANHSRMSLYAWSNLVEAGGDLAIRPSDTVRLAAGYRYVGLADPKGRWITGALNTVGADPTNESAELGHEVDATLRVTPWDPISFQAGYGLFLLGEGGKNILTAVERPHGEMQHWGYLQATVTAP